MPELEDYWRRREEGLCVDCGTPTDGFARCEPCRAGRRGEDPDASSPVQSPFALAPAMDAVSEPREPAIEVSTEVRRAIKAWSDELIDTTARNRLLHYRHLRTGTLDLGRGSAADACAVIDLIDDGATMLSTLFPDEEDHKQARHRARAIRRKTIEYREERGIPTLYLGYGFATWNRADAGPVHNAPVLLSAAQLEPRGRLDADFNFVLEEEWEVNYSLLYVLRTEFGVQIDEAAFPDGIGARDIGHVYRRLADACAELPGFAIADGIVLGNFSFAKLPMVRDLEGAASAVASHPLVAALANDPDAKAGIRAKYAPELGDGSAVAGDPTPSEEFLVLDADATQSAAIRSSLAGNDMVLIGPPGTGKSQTIANLIAAQAANGRTVLFVAEKSAAIDAVAKRLADVGLGDLVLDLHGGTRNRRRIAEQLASAIETSRTARETETEATHDQLVRARGELNLASESLHDPIEPWQLSAYDAQGALLAMQRGETLAVRLHGNALEELVGEQLDQVRGNLREFVNLHRQAFGGPAAPRDAWSAAYRAGAVASDQQVGDLLRLVPRALSTLRELRSTRAQFAGDDAWKRVERAGSVTTQDEAEALLDDIRTALAAISELRDLVAEFDAPAVWQPLADAGKVTTAEQVESLLDDIRTALAAVSELSDLVAEFDAPAVWQPLADAGKVTTAEQVESLLDDIRTALAAVSELSDLVAEFDAPAVWQPLTDAGKVTTIEQVESLLESIRAYLDVTDRLSDLEAEFDAAAVWHATDAAGTVTSPEAAEQAIAAIGTARSALPRLRDAVSGLAARSGLTEAPNLAATAGLIADARERELALGKAQTADAAVHDAELAAGAQLTLLAADLAPASGDVFGRLQARLLNARYRRALAAAAAIPQIGTAKSPAVRRGHILNLLAERNRTRAALEPFDIKAERPLADFDSTACRELLKVVQDAVAIAESTAALEPSDETAWEELASRIAALDDAGPALRLLPEIIELRNQRATLLRVIRSARAVPRESGSEDWDALETTMAKMDEAGGVLHLLPRIIELRDICDAPLRRIRSARALPRKRGEEDWSAIEAKLAALDQAGERLHLLPRIIELRGIRDALLRRIRSTRALQRKLDESWSTIEAELAALDQAGDRLRLLPRIIELHGIRDASLRRIRNARALRRKLGEEDWPAIEAELSTLDQAGDRLRLLPRIIELEHALGDALAVLKSAQAVGPSEDQNWDALDAKLAALDDQDIALRQMPRMIELRTALSGGGIGRVRQQAIERGWDGEAAVRALDYVRMASIYEAAQSAKPPIAAFNRENHDAHLSDFLHADREHIGQGAARIRRAWGEAATHVRGLNHDQEEIIKHEAGKKRRHRSMRNLIDEAPDILLALKPCWAMSPLVVAQLLPTSPPPFDVVIFDEASQIPPADAISSLLRGRQAVVAGDEKQLPPTTFFTQSSADEEEREDDEELPTDNIESILKAMSTLLSSPRANKSLGWHYRSRDERLIAFANHHVYDGRMTTFPGALADDCISHVEVPFSQRAVQQRGSNSAEVERVVELILRHARERPRESLGVIAFGLHHANRIEETLLQTRRDRPELDEFFSEAADEPFFVKNLERVQGDERDAIILSVGYGRGEDGRMRYAFGPINQEGGHRRLNVAITRAKRRMTIVSTFGPNDLDRSRIRAEGARLLCDYITYAATNGRELGRVDVDKPPLNDFERDIQQRLEAADIKIETQYGASGYRIDFAALHPEQPGRPVLAIEADGASYHSSQSARDRDRLRQEHLERLGWRFHRIWSTEYFRNPEREIDRAVAAWRSAVAAADAPEPEPPEEPAAAQAPAPPDPPATQPQRGPKPNLGPKRPITEYAPHQLQIMITWVKSDGILRTEDEIIKETADALGFKRHGSRIKAAIRKIVRLQPKSPRRTDLPGP